MKATNSHTSQWNNSLVLLWKRLLLGQLIYKRRPDKKESHSQQPHSSIRLGVAIVALLMGCFAGFLLSYYTKSIDQPPLTLIRTRNKSSKTCSRATGFEDVSPCLPKFFIGGAMKCGTNEVMNLIKKHPRVKFKTCSDPNDKINCSSDEFQGVEYKHRTKGHHVLNLWESKPRDLISGRKGILRFLNRLPDNDGLVTVSLDKSPTFLETYKHPTLPETVHKLMPDTKMVFSLCDPAERLVSEFYHYHRSEDLRQEFYSEFTGRGLEPPQDVAEFIDIITLSSSQCVENAPACKYIKDIYFPKGLYYEALLDWLKWYDPSDLLVLNMKSTAEQNVVRMMELAGLPPREYPWETSDVENAFRNADIAGYTGRSDVWDEYPKEMSNLAALYSDSNKALAALIKEDFPLSWSSNGSN